MKRNKEVDKYIDEVSDQFRPSLSHLREKIFEYLPKGEEVYAYRIPVYKYKGKALFSIAAFKDHYSLITQDKNISEKIQELKNYKISGTTIHFTVKNPVSDELLRKIIQERISSRNS